MFTILSFLKYDGADMWDQLDDRAEHPHGLGDNKDGRCLRCCGAGELRIPDGYHGVKIVICSCQEKSNAERDAIINPDPW